MGKRLGIPASWRSFINHGACAFGVTFPENAGQGSTWNVELVRQIAAANAAAARAITVRFNRPGQKKFSMAVAVDPVAATLAELRAARYQCGHCVCCEACTLQLERCPSCRVGPIRVVARGAALAFEASFVS